MGNTGEISKEERWMIAYLDDLKDAGIVKEYTHQPEPLLLTYGASYPFRKTFKRKEDEIVQKTLIHEHVYTADFLITWKYEGISKLCISFEDLYGNKLTTKLPPFICDGPTGSKELSSYIEIKGEWDMNNMTRLFRTRTQPFIFEKYEIYVNLVKIPQLFKDTFIPSKIEDEFYYKRKTKKNNIGDKKYKWDYRTLKLFLNE